MTSTLAIYRSDATVKRVIWRSFVRDCATLYTGGGGSGRQVRSETIAKWLVLRFS